MNSSIKHYVSPVSSCPLHAVPYIINTTLAIRYISGPIWPRNTPSFYLAVAPIHRIFCFFSSHSHSQFALSSPGMRTVQQSVLEACVSCRIVRRPQKTGLCKSKTAVPFGSEKSVKFMLLN